MASIRKHAKSRYWYACITLPDGRLKQFTTGLTDAAEARAVAIATEHAIRKYHAMPHALTASFARLAAEFIPKADCHPVEWITRWTAQQAGTRAADTSRLYRDTVADLAAHMTAHNLDTWHAMTQAQAVALRKGLEERGLGPGTINAKIVRLNTAWRAAIQAGVTTENPWSVLKPLKVPRTARREFRPAELETLLGAVSGEWRALTLLGLHTGQRINDLAGLKWANIDTQAGTITFTAAKTRALVCLPLAAPALESLLQDIPSADTPDAPVFPTIQALPRQRRSDGFHAILVSVGLAMPPGGAKGSRRTSPLSFHSLRHTFTTRLKSAGVSDSIARAIVGHASAEVSRSYTHLDMDTMRRAINQTVS
jgi:integrase